MKNTFICSETVCSDALRNTDAGKIWTVASYARLSKEDGFYGKSESITEQCKLIEEWVLNRGNAVLVAQYTDDGFSGANFDRPGFKQMITDAKQGLFDTIVVKDLSRFGRSYLDCGNWIERTLPDMGIRLYSITDNFNSMDGWDFDTALLVPIKNLMNEMLVITTSEKVRHSLAAKRKRGEYVANYAPYGYIKDPCNKHRLIIDAAAASVIREIFELFLAGESASAIAKRLNDARIPSPALHKKLAGSNFQTQFGQAAKKSAWHAASVLRILRDETYTGTLVQGKTQRANWRSGLRKDVPADHWQRIPKSHEAIISMADFNKVMSLLAL